jgi:exopolysaccharide biosynthesis predicted pyruvyltransferase EpsI
VIQDYQFSNSQIAKLREDIAGFLQQYKGQTIYFYPNPGNAGDSLIAVGTYHAFDRAGISFKLIGLDDEVNGQTVFLGGGGNLVHYYRDMRSAYERFLGKAKQIVLLPHTIRGHEDILRTLDASCIVFCRERESYDFVQAVNPSLDCRLAHDMAFHVDLEQLSKLPVANPQIGRLPRKKLLSKGYSIKKIRKKRGMDMLRLDCEANANSPSSDLDVSTLFAMGVTPNEAPVAAWCFLKVISLANHINTDRLHVAIGAALLDKPCTLRNNSYGKNRSVFRHSLSDFPLLTFCDEYGRSYGLHTTQRMARIWHWLTSVGNRSKRLVFCAWRNKH